MNTVAQHLKEHNVSERSCPLYKGVNRNSEQRCPPCLAGTSYDTQNFHAGFLGMKVRSLCLSNIPVVHSRSWASLLTV